MEESAATREPRVAVVVMAKRPVPGRTKTRLHPALSPEDAADLYAAMLADRCAQVARLRGVMPAIALADAGGDALPADILPAGFELITSSGAGLGADLLAAADRFLGQGVPVILVDSDSPTLPIECLREAVEVLQGRGAASDRDVVLGASEDGGYYLIGLRKPAPGLFREIPWSTAQVAEVTLARAAELGLKVHRLADWWDVDTPADLARLQGSLLQGCWPTRTADWLRERETRSRQADSNARPSGELWSAPWHRLSTRDVYANPWLAIREDQVRLPDGKQTLYGVVEMGECVGVLPFVDADTVLMVHQYRYVAGRVMLEMPTGGVDPGENIEAAARRELAEEASVRAGRLDYLGAYHTDKSVVSETAHLYIAHDLSPATVERHDETEFIRAEELPFQRVLDMVLNGEIMDGITIIAVLRAARMRGE